MPESKDSLISEINDGFAHLMEVVKSIDEEKMLARSHAGAWSIKDELAHLASWQEILLRFHMRNEPFAVVVGLPGADYDMTSEDEVNAHLFERHRDRPLADILSYLQETYGAVLDELEQTDTKQLSSPAGHRLASQGEGASLVAYVRGNTVGHYEEHLQTITSAVAE